MFSCPFIPPNTVLQGVERKNSQPNWATENSKILAKKDKKQEEPAPAISFQSMTIQHQYFYLYLFFYVPSLFTNLDEKSSAARWQ